MNEEWAQNHLKTIRTLMERAAVYRRAMGPIALLTGAMGVAGGLIGWGFQWNAIGSFILFWTLWAVVTLVAVFLGVRVQALRDREPIWSPPTRRVALALFPPLFLGLVVSLVAGLLSDALGQSHVLLISLWIALFGVALHGAGFFMQRGIRFVGYVFLAVGAALGVGEAWVGIPWDPHFLMGLTFGGLHLVYGVYLRITERS